MFLGLILIFSAGHTVQNELIVIISIFMGTLHSVTWNRTFRVSGVYCNAKHAG